MQQTRSRESRMRMIALIAIGMAETLGHGQAKSSRYRNPMKSISKAEREKRNIRKKIANQSKKRNRR